MMKIKEGNRLIIDLMELKASEWAGRYSVSQDQCSCREDTAEQAFDGFAGIAKYHESWDWLMPVVKKIQMEIPIIPPRNSPAWMAFYGMETSLVCVDIQLVWEQCIVFIEWYNANKNKD